MKSWLTVAKREMAVRVTEKSFWITTIITMVLILAAVIIPSILAQSSSKFEVATTDALAEQIVKYVDSGSEDEWVAKPYPDAAAAAEAVGADAADMALTKTAQGWTLTLKQFSQNSTTQVQRFKAAIAEVVTRLNAQEQGVDVAKLTQGTALEVATTKAESNEQAAFSYLAGVLFAVLFFMSTMLFGTQIAASVIKEKESRVIEILTAAVPTRQLLLGKIVGNSLLAFLQIILFVGTAIAAAGFSFGAVLPSLAKAGIWFMLFFITGFLALACLWAAAGAMATKYEDINSTAMPMNTLLMLGYVAAFAAPPVLVAALSYIPIISSILMPMRLLDGSAAWWEALLALLANLAFMAVGIVIGSALYRRGVLQTGGVLKWRDAFTRAS